jgi:hypothetical protein
MQLSEHEREVIGAGLFGFVSAIPIMLLVAVFIF